MFKVVFHVREIIWFFNSKEKRLIKRNVKQDSNVNIKSTNYLLPVFIMRTFHLIWKNSNAASN